MLAKRVIPVMLCRGRTLVKGEKFAGDRSVGHAMQAAQVHARRGVDELLLLDIAASKENRGPDLKMVEELSSGCFIPICVGGGVKSIQDIRDLLLAGADKILLGIGSRIPGLLEAASSRFGKQAIVVSVDADGWEPGDAATVATEMEERGAGEILLQNKARDGCMTGFDLDLIREVSDAVGVPVVAAGGCSGYEDMLSAFKAGADGCGIGALFQFTDATPRAAAKYLRDHGVSVRL